MSYEYFARPPFGIGQDNEFEVIKFTGGDVADTRNHAVNQLPAAITHWSGRRVMMLAMVANVHFAFSKFSTAEVDRAVAATNAGVTTKVGGVLIANLPLPVQLPTWQPGQMPYFAREADAINAVVWIWLADEPGNKRNP